MRQFMTVGIFMLLFRPAAAHPPTSIEIDYNRETHWLKVTLHHPVDDTTKHIISEVEIKLNGEEHLKQKYLRQSEAGLQTVWFYLPDVQSGDKLEVIGHCNVFGKKKETFTLP